MIPHIPSAVIGGAFTLLVWAATNLVNIGSYKQRFLDVEKVAVKHDELLAELTKIEVQNTTLIAAVETRVKALEDESLSRRRRLDALDIDPNEPRRKRGKRG